MNLSNFVRSKFFLLFLAYGTIAGLISIAVWPRDPFYIFLFNAPGLWLGDLAYSFSINFFGNSSSQQAHYTIPWMLRVPQIYFFTSVVFWFILGVVVHFYFLTLHKN